MIAPTARLHTTLLALALALAGIVSPVSAETLKLPKGQSEFVMDLPDGWSHEMDQAGFVSCAPPDNSKGPYALIVVAMPDAHSKADVKKQLPGFAKDFAAGAKVTDLETAEIDDIKNSNGVSFIGLAGSGKKKDLTATIVVQAFEPQKGKWYVIFTLGSEAADKAYSDDYATITDSIQPVK